MKRLLTLTVLMLAFGAYCAHFVPAPVPAMGVIVLHAQTLPITKTLVWDPNPAADNVTNYTVTLDAATVGNPVTTSQSVTFNTLGNHTLTLTATNIFGTSAAQTLIVKVQSPGSPTGAKLQ